MRQAFLITALLVGALNACAAESGIELVTVATGLVSPVTITHAPGDASRLFVVEQRGRILILRDGAVVATPFLDITDRVVCCGERGLLSIAFHPLHPSNGHFFVNYTGQNGRTVVSRFVTLAGNPDRADAASETIVLTVDQPFANHNGGQLQFGPDGYLYIGMGDGGSAGDPGNRAQNLLDLLGKMLRIDVDVSPYAIPPDNPYSDTDQARSEIWASGLRNPWRFSFDRETGDLFIADVGQGRIEEVNFQPASSRGGENYGWRRMEGSDCFNPAANCTDGSLVLPILQYTHDEGCSVTGGYAYRGPSKRLRGMYFYGDYCSGKVWGAVRRGDGSWENVAEVQTSAAISSFGEDLAGNVYVVDIGGRVFRIEDTGTPRRRAVRR
jgi:glucose/arabinose dehydrogenase